MTPEKSLQDFCASLASSSPTPGGGGAAALVGALAAALGEMVTNLTIGKKKYAAYEAELIKARTVLTEARQALLLAIDRDAAVFTPLAEAYRLPAGEARDRAEQLALIDATEAPLDAMALMAGLVPTLRCVAEKGSRLAVSDAAAAGTLLYAAIRAMSLNVFINTAAMHDGEKAKAYNARAMRYLADAAEADVLCGEIMRQLRGEGELDG